MTDIVERLRKLAERERPYGSLPDTLDEAAAEIERLRAGNRDLQLWFDDLKIEYDKLRAALREIINLGGAYGIGLLRYADRIARAALAEEKQ